MKMTINVETNLPASIPAGLIIVDIKVLDQAGELIFREQDGEVERSPDAVADKVAERVRAEVLKYATMVDNSDFGA